MLKKAASELIHKAPAKNPLHRKWWVFAVSVLLSAMLLTSCGSANEEGPAAPDSKAPASVSQPEILLPDASEPEGSDNAEPGDPAGSSDYSAALSKAKEYCDLLHMSKNGIYRQLSSEAGENFSAKAAQYAVDNLDADWNQNALAKAKEYSESAHLSKAGLYDQLVSEAGEGFTAEQAQYAVDNLQADWNQNALEKAKIYQQSLNMSKDAIYDQLVSQAGEKFTAEQAQYAVDNLD